MILIEKFISFGYGFLLNKNYLKLYYIQMVERKYRLVEFCSGCGGLSTGFV